MDRFLILAILANFIVISFGKPQSPVFVLNDANFEAMLRGKKVMLVEFFAPWCSDCAKLAPEYEAAAFDLAREKKFVLAKIDCFGKGKGTCDRFGVRQWPTLKLFRYGNYAGDYIYKQDRGSLKMYMDLLVKQDPGQKPLQDAALKENDPMGPNLNPYRPWGWKEGGWSFYPMAPGCGQDCG